MGKVLKFGSEEYGEVGKLSPFRTIYGTKLYVGDVVEILSSRDYHFVVENDGQLFIMGLQRASEHYNESTGQIDGWEIKLIKNWQEVKVGERYDSIKLVMEQQLKDIKEDKVLKFKKGDKVRIIKDVMIRNVKIGDIGVIGDRSLDSFDVTNKVIMDKDYDYWFISDEDLELVDDTKVQVLTITTHGTDTTVNFIGGGKGTAKLYHGGVYSKGFGIIVALGKCLGIDLVDEVVKVVKSYDKPMEAVKCAEEGGFIAKGLINGMNSFKVNDTVEVITNDTCYISCRDRKGERGVITRKDNNDDTCYIDFDTTSLWFKEKDIKLVTLDELCQERADMELVGHKRMEQLKAEVDADIQKFIDSSPQYSKDTNNNIGKSVKNPILKDEIKITKFKNGDKVRLISNTSGTRLKIGDIGTVVDDKRQYSLRLEKDGNSTGNNITAKELELVEDMFKIGDKVKLVKSYSGRYMEHLGNDFIIVDMDEFDGNYVLGGLNWEFDKEELQLVETKADIEKKNEMKAAEIKAGDKVIINSDLRNHMFDLDIVEDMLNYAGKYAIITRIARNGKYDIDIDNGEYFWTKNMFTKYLPKSEKSIFDEFAIGDYVKVKTDLIEDKMYDEVDVFTDSMEKYVGKVYKIKNIIHNNKIFLEGTGCWTFTPSMLDVVKVGDVVDKENAILILKAGGKIKNDDMVYFVEDNVLKFYTYDGQIMVSGGYDDNLYGVLEVESLD